MSCGLAFARANLLRAVWSAPGHHSYFFSCNEARWYLQQSVSPNCRWMGLVR